MAIIIPLIVAISSLPIWWWTKGPGLGDPPRFSLTQKIILFFSAIAGGLLSAYLIGNENETIRAFIAFAGGRIGSGLSLAALNPQPLPPKSNFN